MGKNSFIHGALAGLILATAHAQQNTTPATTTLPEVVVTGKAEDLLGQAQTASKGQASAAEI